MMDRRIHQALDGEVDRQDLTRSLASELANTEADLQRLVDAIPDEPLVDLSASVLQRIASARDERTQRAADTRRNPMRGPLAWLWTPQPTQWRPVYALAAAAALVLAALGGGALSRTEPAVPAAGATHVFVQFRLEAPDASGVVLAGDFTEWQPAYVMTRSASGVWTVVVPVEPGVHEYAFIVDGTRWMPDPHAPAIDDGFGGVNSRLAVLTPDAARPL